MYFLVYSKHEIDIIEQMEKERKMKCMAQTIGFKRNKRPHRLELLGEITLKGNIITGL